MLLWLKSIFQTPACQKDWESARLLFPNVWKISISLISKHPSKYQKFYILT